MLGLAGDGNARMRARGRSHSRIPIWERVGAGNGKRRRNKGFAFPDRGVPNAYAIAGNQRYFLTFPRSQRAPTT
jgi:hypothetical protein